MRVLISSIGRRGYLANWFRDAGQHVATDVEIYGSDVDANAPALSAVDVAIVMPRVTSNDYLDTLEEMCRKHNINLLVSVNDYDLAVLSAHLHRFDDMGISAVVPPKKTLELAGDKYLMANALSEHEIDVPDTFLAGTDSSHESWDHGVVVKHRYGSGSSGVFIVDRQLAPAAIELSVKSAPSSTGAVTQLSDLDLVVVQKQVKGEEYGLDILCDFQGNFQGVLARKKLRMRAGETDRAVTVDPSPFIETGEKLSKSFSLCGTTDVDVILTDEGRVVVIDINPRFGGGYPFMHVAGANIPACYIAWASGMRHDPSWLEYQPGVISNKYTEVRRSGMS